MTLVPKLLQTCMSFSVLLNTKDTSIEFFSLHSIEFCVYQQLFVTNKLQNIFFCVQQMKETHECLEQLQGE